MTGEILKGKIRKCTERKEDETGINTSFARDVPAAMLANHAVKFSYFNYLSKNCNDSLNLAPVSFSPSDLIHSRLRNFPVKSAVYKSNTYELLPERSGLVRSSLTFMRSNREYKRIFSRNVALSAGIIWS